MEIVIDPAQMWQQFIAFANDYKLLTSLVFLVILHYIKKGLLRLIKRRSSRKGEDRRNQINILEQLGNALIIILLMVMWSSEIQTLAPNHRHSFKAVKCDLVTSSIDSKTICDLFGQPAVCQLKIV